MGTIQYRRGSVKRAPPNVVMPFMDVGGDDGKPVWPLIKRIFWVVLSILTLYPIILLLVVKWLPREIFIFFWRSAK